MQVQALTMEPIKAMTAAELKLQLKACGVSTGGKKTVLQARLFENKDTGRAQSARLYCGCLNTDQGLVTWLRNANMKLLIEAGQRRDPAWYRVKLQQLFVCLTTNKHDGTCMHVHVYSSHVRSHPCRLSPCTGCAHHDAGYSVPEKLLVFCPFHKAVIRKYFYILDENAKKLIDPVLGRVYNNFLESGFPHVWVACPKRM